MLIPHTPNQSKTAWKFGRKYEQCTNIFTVLLCGSSFLHCVALRTCTDFSYRVYILFYVASAKQLDLILILHVLPTLQVIKS